MATPFKHPKTGVYYIRRAVPEDLRQAIGKAEYECETVFAKARSQRDAVDVLDDGHIKEVGEAWVAHILGEDEELRLRARPEELFAQMRESLRP